MMINIPKEFKTKARLSETYLDSKFNPITDSVKLKELKKDDPIILLELETKNKANSISITLTPLTDLFLQLIGDTTQLLDFAKKGMIATARQATENFDTLFSKIKIGALTFDKLFVSSKMNDITLFHGGYFARLNDYYLIITMDFISSRKAQMMNAVETAKFD